MRTYPSPFRQKHFVIGTEETQARTPLRNPESEQKHFFLRGVLRKNFDFPQKISPLKGGFLLEFFRFFPENILFSSFFHHFSSVQENVWKNRGFFQNFTYIFTKNHHFFDSKFGIFPRKSGFFLGKIFWKGRGGCSYMISNFPIRIEK